MINGETREKDGLKGVEVCPTRNHIVLEYEEHDEELVDVDRIYIGE